MSSNLQLPDPAMLPATRTRVKWENVAILAGGAVVATFAVVLVLIQGAEQKPTTQAPVQPQAAVTPTDGATVEPEGALTMTDALGLVEEARQFIAEARWDEAAERLESVPAELREVAGATELAAVLETTRTRHEQLRAELVAAVEARRWTEAEGLLEQLAAIAPLDVELQAQQALVQQGLAPAAPTRRTDARPAAAAAAAPTRATGGDTTPSRPAAQPARPSVNASRPAPATPSPAPSSTPARPSAPTGGGASAPAALDPLAPVELTPEQEAELAAALGIPSGELR